MVWGAPDFEYDYKFFGNVGMDLGDRVEAYGYGNYAKRRVEGGFFYRNPHTRSGVFDGGEITQDGTTYDTVKVADLDGIDMGGSCPAIRIIDNVASAEDLAAVEADPNCESFISRFPGGFVPRFGGVMEDYSFAFGVRGELPGDWHVDLGGVYGRHETAFFMRHTLNPQLLAMPGITVANIPTDYRPGNYTETDYSINLDVTRILELPLLYSPVNVAFGFEHRQEEFKVTQGGENSWFQDLRPGGLTEQGFGVGSNGFTGFGPRLAGTWSRNSYAGYVDVEAELTQGVVLGAAGRYEDHKGVGDTWDFKISARAQVTDALALRGAVSTGFRAPTVGQANILNVTTAFTEGRLADEATLPPTHPASALVGGQPLTPEESTNFTVGAVLGVGDLDLTIDYFNIEVQDRIARSSDKALTEANRQTLIAQGVTDAANFTQLRFYTNDFDTTTQGVDIVATLPLQLPGGNTDLSVAGNWTDTEVDRRNPEVISDKRVIQIEQNNPEFRFTATAQHHQGPWRVLLRGRFYDGFVEFSTDDGGARLDAGSRWLMDAEIGYSLNDHITLVAGAENLADITPTDQSHNESPYPTGMEYAETSPYGFSGGFYYFRAIWDF